MMLMDSELEGARLDARSGHAQPEGAKQALCAVRTETSARRASRAQKRVAQRPEIAVRELAGRHRVAAHESPPLVDAACALGHASPHVLSQCTSTRLLTCETTEQCTFHSTRVLSTLPQPETRMMVQDRTKTSVLGAAAAALLPARARSEARATNPRGLHEQPARAQLVRTQVRAAATPPRLRRRLNAPGCCLPAAEPRDGDAPRCCRRGGLGDDAGARQGAERAHDAALALPAGSDGCTSCACMRSRGPNDLIFGLGQPKHANPRPKV